MVVSNERIIQPSLCYAVDDDAAMLFDCFFKACPAKQVWERVMDIESGPSCNLKEP